MRPEDRNSYDGMGGSGLPGPNDLHKVTDALAKAAAGADARQVLTAQCRACLGLLTVAGASVSLSASSTARVLLCASDDTAARLAEAQYTLGDGPCRRALQEAAPVLAPDLTAGPDAHRWPVFAQQAVELGVRAAFSLPLGTRALAMGTLDLYRDSPGPLSERELRAALLVGDAVTFAALSLEARGSENPEDGDGRVASWVEAAESDHMEVHQAVGMVMVQLGIDPDQALDRLRVRAFVQGRTVSEVARGVLARTLRFPDGDETTPSHEHEKDHRPDSGLEGDGTRS
ncbi:GAF and ANTAR domain-containing protein [Streptomyces violascens]|uniref:GAF and ANTAR domain-containing protein n=1 Tax=Streptomyces violascens TaxID=67381 RepID=UPI0036C71276